MTLVEFLRARLDEERRWLDSHENRTRNGMCDAPGVHLFEPEAYTRVDAERRIVELHDADQHLCPDRDPGGEIDRYATVHGVCLTLRMLALPHTDHPDYDPKWRP